VNVGLRQIAFLLLPAGVVSAVLAEPITRLCYQRGAWGPHETAVTAGAVAAFSAGLVFNGWMLMLNRAFFSLQSNWLPMGVAGANLALNALLDALFYRFGTWGIPLATTLVNVAGSVLLLVLLRRRIGHIDLGRTLPAIGRIVAASLPLAGVAVGVWYGIDREVGRSLWGQLASLVPALAAGAAAYFAACKLLGVRELQTVVGLRSRLRRD
jgi:putative peptidoglycan lipid II flippase